MNFRITHDTTRYIVRCKNCRYYNAETRGCKRNPSVEAWKENDFCSYGCENCKKYECEELSNEEAQLVSLIETYGVTEDIAKQLAKRIGDRSFYIGKSTDQPKGCAIVGVDVGDGADE